MGSDTVGDLDADDYAFGLILVVAALLWPVLTVAPFDYGPAESTVVSGALALWGLLQFVFDDALTREQ